MDINKDSTWEELTPGGTIYEAGNAREFKTGDWRSMRPVTMWSLLPSLPR